MFIRLKMHSSEHEAVHGVETNIAVDSLLSFTPEFDRETMQKTGATLVVTTGGAVAVQESCQSIRSRLRKLQQEAVTTISGAEPEVEVDQD